MSTHQGANDLSRSTQDEGSEGDQSFKLALLALASASHDRDRVVSSVLHSHVLHSTPSSDLLSSIQPVRVEPTEGSNPVGLGIMVETLREDAFETNLFSHWRRFLEDVAPDLTSELQILACYNLQRLVSAVKVPLPHGISADIWVRDPHVPISKEATGSSTFHAIATVEAFEREHRVGLGYCMTEGRGLTDEGELSAQDLLTATMFWLE